MIFVPRNSEFHPSPCYLMFHEEEQNLPIIKRIKKI